MGDHFEIACPCGSKRPLSQCHGKYRGFHSTDPDLARVSLYTRLMNYAAKPSFGEVWDAAKAKFFGDLLEELPPEHAEVLIDSEIARFNFSSYLCIHMDSGDGLCLGERFLADHSEALARQERAFLKVLLNTRPSLYEVAEVTKGKAIILKDPYSGKATTIEENHWSTSLDQGSLLSGRIVSLEGGRSTMEDVQVAFPVDLRETVLEETEGLIEALHVADDSSWRPLAERTVHRLYQLWITSILAPVVETDEGPSEACPYSCLLRFKVVDSEVLEVIIENAERFTSSGRNEWTWTRGEVDAGQDICGHLTLYGQWLVVETIDRGHARDLEDCLQEIASDQIALRSAEYLDPQDVSPLTQEGRGSRVRRFTLLVQNDEETA